MAFCQGVGKKELPVLNIRRPHSIIYNTMAKFEKRLKARYLRREGRSISFIAHRLAVSKSSASVWCRDLVLTPRQEKRLLLNAKNAGHIGRLKGAQTNRQKKEDRIQFYIKAGQEVIKELTKHEFLIAGLSLYWAEGNKRSKLGFINSDPAMIKLMFRWFKDIMGVKEEDFMPRIFINAIHKPRIRKVMRFWLDLLKLPRKQFGNPVFLKRNPKKVYENYDSYYGLLTLQVRRSTELKYRILGLIEALKNTSV